MGDAATLAARGFGDGVAISVGLAGMTKVMAVGYACHRRQVATRAAAPRRLLSGRPVVEVGVGVLEIAVAACVTTGIAVKAGAVAMAIMGVAFTMVLAHAWREEFDGDCGCMRGRASTHGVTTKVLIRAACVAVGGAIIICVPSSPVVLDRPEALVIAACTVSIMVGASSVTIRRPPCRRRLLGAKRDTLRRLRLHPAFNAVVAANGPVEMQHEYRKVGCVDEFTFRFRGETDVGAMFRVMHGRDGNLAVQGGIRRQASQNLSRGANRG